MSELTGHRIVDELREACGYDPEAEGSVDDLIAYKDALEDLVFEVDVLALCTSDHPAAELVRDGNGWVRLSAADVTGALFSKGFGKTKGE